MSSFRKVQCRFIYHIGRFRDSQRLRCNCHPFEFGVRGLVTALGFGDGPFEDTRHILHLRMILTQRQKMESRADGQLEHKLFKPNRRDCAVPILAIVIHPGNAAATSTGCDQTTNADYS